MKVLLLAGTAEARELAARLADAGIPALASLAGATRRPEPLPLPTRVGGFGGAEGFRAVLRDEGITAVIDATHPFAARITARTARICAEDGLPCLHLIRRRGYGVEVGVLRHAYSQAERLARQLQAFRSMLQGRTQKPSEVREEALDYDTDPPF